jgi:hypothetical protein
MKMKRAKSLSNKPRWVTQPSVVSDKNSLRDYYKNELFTADVDAVFVTPDGQVHSEGLTSGEVAKVAELAKVLEQLQRRPS